jgi:hypothetical protein
MREPISERGAPFPFPTEKHPRREESVIAEEIRRKEK